MKLLIGDPLELVKGLTGNVTAQTFLEGKWQEKEGTWSRNRVKCLGSSGLMEIIWFHLEKQRWYRKLLGFYM